MYTTLDFINALLGYTGRIWVGRLHALAFLVQHGYGVMYMCRGEPVTRDVFYVTSHEPYVVGRQIELLVELDRVNVEFGEGGRVYVYGSRRVELPGGVAERVRNVASMFMLMPMHLLRRVITSVIGVEPSMEIAGERVTDVATVTKLVELCAED